MVGNATPLAVFLDSEPVARGVAPQRLAQAGFRVREAVARTAAESACEAAGATALLLGDSPLDGEALRSLPELRIVSALTVGLDHVDLEAAREAGVWVANVPDATIEEVATSSLAMILGLVRHVPFLAADVRAGGWDPFASGSRRRPSTLTLAIVGLGRIGQRVAQLAQPFFARLVGHDPASVAAPETVERLALADALACADVLTLHLPAEPGAAPLLDATALALLPRGAFVVNAARGSLIDTAALLAALDAGRLAGAALDVVACEPPPPGHPVRHHPRVLLTPHAAFVSVEAEVEALDRQVENVLAWRQTGRPLTPVVAGRA